MPVPVGRGEVQALIADHAQIVEVLEPLDYARRHLPGALNVPLSELLLRIDLLERDIPVIVYGYDMRCDRSARAARLLERHGFETVFDYAAGKQDWFAYGLPHEGVASPAALDVATPCVRVAAETTVGAALALLDVDGSSLGVVVDRAGIVVGTVTGDALRRAPAGDGVADHVDCDPLTIRPDMPVTELDAALTRGGADRALVTSSSGRLLGQVAAGCAATSGALAATSS